MDWSGIQWVVIEVGHYVAYDKSMRYVIATIKIQEDGKLWVQVTGLHPVGVDSDNLWSTKGLRIVKRVVQHNKLAVSTNAMVGISDPHLVERGQEPNQGIPSGGYKQVVLNDVRGNLLARTFFAVVPEEGQECAVRCRVPPQVTPAQPPRSGS